jgi:hypothetical protein
MFLLLLSACQQQLKEQTNSDTPVDSTNTENIFIAPVEHQTADVEKSLIQLNDTISVPCAILISPSEKRIEVLGEAYHILGGMNNANLRLVEAYLDSIGVMKVFRSSEGTLNFILKKEIVSLDLSQFDWGFILFNGQEPPKKMDVDDMLKNDSSFYQLYHYAMLVPDSVK